MQFLHDISLYPFLWRALAAGVLASVACGIAGSYVVVRRTTYMAGAISHCVLGGMGAARYFQRTCGIEWLTPLWGATAAALFAALLIGWVSVRERQRVDTTLSAVWALGMAVGISFITATPGYNEDLMSYLFGNILMVNTRDLWMMGGLNVIILTATLLFYNRLLVISFNPQTAQLRGVRVHAFELLYLVMTALTVVLLTQIVGSVMVIALLTLPAATAGLFVHRLWVMMAAAVGLSMVATVGGLALSYGPEWPTGATIVEVAGAMFLVGLAVTRFFRARR